MTEQGFLALTPQYSPTRALLAAAARRRGMAVEVLSTGGGAASLRGRPGGHYYGGPKYADRVADDLGVALLVPGDGWLCTLPEEFTRRTIALSTLSEVRELSGPLFVKPPSDKSFPAAVYADGCSLPAGTELPPDLPVQVSEVVVWAAEFRLYVLDGEVRTASQYATYGLLDPLPLDTTHRHHDTALAFARSLLDSCAAGLPSAVVLDIGLLDPTGDWAVVEANMAWFSSCYAADPDRALDTVLRSAGPCEDLQGRDRPYLHKAAVHLADPFAG
ncbi:ATP-grasp domain-containing protein [Streptomyces sp. NPDC021093]|uniref:ATP-grasp domain-containing protein n=1 Tax=Streptomyces sp. NPDC021093 TaxID=3365112 RepID=UPI003799B8D9